jgi:hypothetical protein
LNLSIFKHGLKSVSSNSSSDWTVRFCGVMIGVFCKRSQDVSNSTNTTLYLANLFSVFTSSLWSYSSSLLTDILLYNSLLLWLYILFFFIFIFFWIHVQFSFKHIAFLLQRNMHYRKHAIQTHQGKFLDEEKRSSVVAERWIYMAAISTF